MVSAVVHEERIVTVGGINFGIRNPAVIIQQRTNYGQARSANRW
jgi:hypothetical protein